MHDGPQNRAARPNRAPPPSEANCGPRRFYGPTRPAVLGVRGWRELPVSSTSIIVCAIVGMGGLLLLNLGIVGAYLGRSATEAKERPMYFVADTTAARQTEHSTQGRSTAVERT